MKQSTSTEITDLSDAATVVFLGFGMAVYFKDFLNALVRNAGLRVANVIPMGENQHVGAGVKQDFDDDGLFEVFRLQETLVQHKRIFNLADFETQPSYHSFIGLSDFLTRQSPDIVVVNVTYFDAFFYDSELVQTLKRNDIKVVFRSIPFQLDTFEESLAAIPAPSLEFRSSRFLRVLAKPTGLANMYAKLVRGPALTRRVRARQRIFNSCDAHAIYFEGGCEIYESYGVPRNKITVVRNSPDTDQLFAADAAVSADPECPQEKSCRFIHVGRLVAWKRVDLLIEAVSRLRAGEFPDADLLVVGYGPEEEKLRELANDLGVGSAVQFIGGVYDPVELARLYRSASVYVLAGMGGLSINEAMSFGKPIVCSRCDGTEQFLVRDNENGLYFEEDSIDSLTRALEKMLEVPELRIKMGAQSRSIIENELNIHVLVDNYFALFQRLLAKQ